MRSTLLATLCLCIFLVGCSSSPPVRQFPGSDQVQVDEADPGEDYGMIDKISGTDGAFCGNIGYEGTAERALIKLQNRTYEIGGDYAKVTKVTKPHQRGDCFDNLYRIEAIAYKRIHNIPVPAGAVDEESPATRLRDLKALLDDGILTQAEYEEQKARLLDKGLY